MKYEVANGVGIPRLGQKKVHRRDVGRFAKEYNGAGVRGQQSPARCKEGGGSRGGLVFDNEGSYIEDKQSGGKDVDDGEQRDVCRQDAG